MAKSTNYQKIEELLNNSPDFICIKRFEYSLRKVLERYPEGAPDRVVAQALGITEEQLKVLFEQILVKLRKKML